MPETLVTPGSLRLSGWKGWQGEGLIGKDHTLGRVSSVVPSYAGRVDLRAADSLLAHVIGI